MALTTLDPRPALIVVDLQKGIVNVPAVHPVAEIVERSARLADAFRQRGLPVVLVNVTGGAPGRTERSRPPATTRDSDCGSSSSTRLGARPGDHLVTKQRRSAFHDTGLDAYLRGLGVAQVVLAGISTTAGVDSAARSAFDYGYHVVLAIDAMTDTDADAHANSVARIFPKLGETATTAESSTCWRRPDDAARQAPQGPASRDAHSAWNRPNLQGPELLVVTSRHFDEGAEIPRDHVGRRVGGKNLSPGLTWSPPPAETAPAGARGRGPRRPPLKAGRALPGADRPASPRLAQPAASGSALQARARPRGADPAVDHRTRLQRPRTHQRPRTAPLHLPALRPLAPNDRHRRREATR